jgi:hypothetical protein
VIDMVMKIANANVRGVYDTTLASKLNEDQLS